MASMVPPQYGVAYIFYVALVDQSNTKVFKASSTQAAGDWKISKDGGALTNLTNLPAVTPAGSVMVQISLTATEMQADNVTVVGIDAAGAEWCSLVINIQTSVRRIDDLAYPATSGRAIDVSAGGEVGLDWANIGSPTTTVALSGTTVKTATDVETDTQDIQARLPAALVSGRIDASAGAIAANAITATAIASDAITDAKVASDVTIASVTGAVGSVTGNVGGNVVGSVASVTAGVTLAAGAVTAAAIAADAITAAKIADGAIDAATFASGAINAAAIATDAITAAKIAADAIGASELAADAVTEIQSGLATSAALTTVAGYIDTEVASILAAVDTEVAAIKAKTDNLPAAPAATSDIPTVADILAGVVEGSITLKGALRLTLAVLTGKSTGGGTTTITFRDVADAKARVTETVTTDGNRTAVTRDITD